MAGLGSYLVIHDYSTTKVLKIFILLNTGYDKKNKTDR